MPVTAVQNWGRHPKASTQVGISGPMADSWSAEPMKDIQNWAAAQRPVMQVAHLRHIILGSHQRGGCGRSPNWTIVAGMTRNRGCVEKPY